MEARIEAERLEEQVHQGNYSLEEEFADLQFKPDERVMDAGCGTGVLARFLARRYGVQEIDGLDFSDLRIRQARELLDPDLKETIRFHQQDLARLDARFHGGYDAVISRFVIEHVPEPEGMLVELRKALKPGGRLIVIEMDGVFLNLSSENPVFKAYMKELESKFSFDLRIGRRVPALMKRAGFSRIDWNPSLLVCKGERLVEEKVNTEKRFSAVAPFLTEVLGSIERFEDFRRLYLEEMLVEGNTLVFSKFVCSGIRA